MSLTHTRLRAAVRVMRYYNSVPLLGAVQTTSLLLVMIQNEASSLSALIFLFEGQCRICPVQSFASCQFTGSFDCIPKTTRWSSGTKEAVADEEK